MKILFKTIVQNGVFQKPKMIADYQNDSLFHGLHSLHGNEVVDFPQMNHMYEDYKEDFSLFSLYKLIKQEHRAPESERDDLINKIKNKYFDIVVLAIHHTRDGHWGVIKEEADFILK